MSDVTLELAMEASDKAVEIARLKAENDRLRNDADLLRAMLSQKRTEKQCYMAENAKLRTQLADVTVSMGRVEGRCAKLRELARLLLYGATHDAEPAEGLVWSQKVNVLVRELGIEVDE